MISVNESLFLESELSVTTIGSIDLSVCPPDLRPQTLVIVSLYVIIFIVSLVGNGMVIVTILVTRQLRTLTNVLLLNLALSDLLLTVACLPSTLVTITFRCFFFGSLACNAISYLQPATVTASAHTLVVIAVERYYAIVEPLRALHFRSRRHSALALLTVWGIALTFNLPFLVYARNVNLKPGVYNCQIHWPAGFSIWYLPLLTILILVLPLAALVALYSMVISTLWTDIRGHQLEKARRKHGSTSPPPCRPIHETSDHQHKDTIVRTGSPWGRSKPIFKFSEPAIKTNIAPDSSQAAPILPQPHTTVTPPRSLSVRHDFARTSSLSKRKLGKTCHTSNGVSQNAYERYVVDFNSDGADLTPNIERHSSSPACEVQLHQSFYTDVNPLEQGSITPSCHTPSLDYSLSLDKSKTLKQNFSLRTKFLKFRTSNPTDRKVTPDIDLMERPQTKTSITTLTPVSQSSRGFTLKKLHSQAFTNAVRTPEPNTDSSVEKATSHQSRRDLLRKIPTIRCNQDEKNLLAKRRLIIMLIVIVMEFFACWSPFFTFNLINAYGYIRWSNPLCYHLYSAFLMLAYVSSCTNPVTYCFMNARFRNALVNLWFRCRCPCCPGDRGMSSKRRAYLRAHTATVVGISYPRNNGTHHQNGDRKFKSKSVKVINNIKQRTNNQSNELNNNSDEEREILT